MTAAIFQNHHRDRLGRSNIIPRREIGLFDIAEYLLSAAGGEVMTKRPHIIYPRCVSV